MKIFLSADSYQVDSSIVHVVFESDKFQTFTHNTTFLALNQPPNLIMYSEYSSKSSSIICIQKCSLLILARAI